MKWERVREHMEDSRDNLEPSTSKAYAQAHVAQEASDPIDQASGLTLYLVIEAILIIVSYLIPLVTLYLEA